MKRLPALNGTSSLNVEDISQLRQHLDGRLGEVETMTVDTTIKAVIRTFMHNDCSL